jgi:hypothetical protein
VWYTFCNMTILKAKDDVIIQDGTDQYQGKIVKVDTVKAAVLVERRYSKDVTTTLWVPMSKIFKHKSN